MFNEIETWDWKNSDLIETISQISKCACDPMPCDSTDYTCPIFGGSHVPMCHH